jgi:hypothetical protein
MTDAGPFDLLAGLEAAGGHLVLYEELVRRATVLQGERFVVRAAGHSKKGDLRGYYGGPATVLPGL